MLGLLTDGGDHSRTVAVTQGEDTNNLYMRTLSTILALLGFFGLFVFVESLDTSPGVFMAGEGCSVALMSLSSLCVRRGRRKSKEC